MKTLYMISILILSLTAAGSLVAGEGSGSVKVGYIYTDEDGSREVNQESFNLYEGFGLSLTDWNYAFDNGMVLQANLLNLTLNNRLLETQLTQPGKFSLYANHNQYRRFYDFGGERFTRRNLTNARLSVTPTNHIELFGAFNLQNKHGERELIPLSSYDTGQLGSPGTDTDAMVTNLDWRQTRYTGGLKWDNRKSMVRAFYRYSTFDDMTTRDDDQTGNEINALASTVFPWYDRLFLSGGYIFRKSELDNREAELAIHQGWGAAKLRLPSEFVLEYRLVYGYAERVSEEDRTVDNLYHQAAVGKNFGRYGGLRAAYENRIKDDFIQKVTSNGFIINGWLRPTERLSFDASFTTRSEDTDEGQRLLGDMDITRHQVTAQYADTSWGRARIKWQQRIRENDPLFTEGLSTSMVPTIVFTTPETDEVNTRVEYSALTPEVTFHRTNLGSLTVTYSMITGTYENAQDTANYEFRDHVLTGTVVTRPVGPVTADFAATYFRSRRDNDIEKFNLNFGLMFSFLRTHHVEARYNVFNFDDFRVLDENYTEYYTGNIVEVNLIKDLNF